MKKYITWNENGWTAVQDADAVKHKLEISCRAENGIVLEVRTRHNDGEVKKGEVTLDGKNALPMPLAEFAKLFANGKLEIR